MRLFMVSCKGQCPLGSKARLLWSMLVYRHRFNRQSTRSWLRRMSGIDIRTVNQGIKSLLSVNLITDVEGRLSPVEPNGETREWFVWRNNDKVKWTERLAYFPVNLGDNELSPSANSVYWL